MTAPGGSVPSHVFTVDTEEYYHAHALRDRLDDDRQERLPSRVEKGTERLLQQLEDHAATATFFVLGDVARRKPDLIRRIAAAGHEVGSHGMSHRRVTKLTPEEFRREVRESRELLEATIERPVVGFRAPSFSLNPQTKWAFQILAEEGYEYDSSVFPVRAPQYGYPSAPRGPALLSTRAGGLIELPLTTLRWAGIRFPAAGGAYLRLLPYGLSRAALEQAETEGRSGVVYCHPWELDPDQPRVKTGWTTRLRHYGGLERMSSRLDRLLGEFEFTSIAEYLGQFSQFIELDPGRTPASGSAPVSADHSRLTMRASVESEEG